MKAGQDGYDPMALLNPTDVYLLPRGEKLQNMAVIREMSEAASQSTNTVTENTVTGNTVTGNTVSVITAPDNCPQLNKEKEIKIY